MNDSTAVNGITLLVLIALGVMTYLWLEAKRHAVPVSEREDMLLDELDAAITTIIDLRDENTELRRELDKQHHPATRSKRQHQRDVDRLLGGMEYPQHNLRVVDVRD